MPTFNASRRPSTAAHNAGAAVLLAYLRTIADAHGRFVVSHLAIGRALGERVHTIEYRLSLLRATRAVVGEGKGRARITGDEFVAPTDNSKPDRTPPSRHSGARFREAAVQTELSWLSSCSYRNCRELGIEPYPHILHNRTLGGEAGVGDVVISLARIPSLERPLPEIWRS